MVQKLCCHKDIKILQKNCTTNCKKSRTAIKGEGGRVVGGGGVPTLVSRCGLVGQRIHGKGTVGRLKAGSTGNKSEQDKSERHNNTP